MSRKPKFGPERCESILELLRQGVPQQAAAHRSGITEKSFYRWLERGRNEEKGPYHDFVLAVEAAHATAETALVLRIQTHSRKDWRAAAFLLERRFPDRWREHRIVETQTTEVDLEKVESRLREIARDLDDNEPDQE
jgi:transposase